MRLRHTRRTDASLNGPTTQRSIRFPAALLSLVEGDIARGVSEIHTLTDAVTDALWLWHYEQNLVKAAEIPPEIPRAKAEHWEAAYEAPVESVSLSRPTFADVDMDALDEPLDEDG